LVVSILCSEEGVIRAATEGGGQGLDVVVGAVDKKLGGANGGMIVPG
jgi:uracil phosphoribosyltransferase